MLATLLAVSTLIASFNKVGGMDAVCGFFGRARLSGSDRLTRLGITEIKLINAVKKRSNDPRRKQETRINISNNKLSNISE